MYRFRIFCCWQVVLIIFFSQEGKAQELNLIPMPKQVELRPSTFVWDETVVFVVEKKSFESDYFLTQVNKLVHLKTFDHSKQSTEYKKISFELVPTSYFKDSLTSDYELEITPNSIHLKSHQATGIFHGIQTLIQLINTSRIGTAHILPCLKIHDAASFSWRGMHLDVSRHFFPPEFIKKYIDYLSYYKMNVFHWHLTDDQGWRIQLDQFPALTTIGAWRNGSMIGHYNEGKVDTLRYGGFYTKNEIREIVQYAAERHITVVPEIEMPGHALAALSAYPALSCTGGPFEVGKIWGVYDDVFCTKEETFLFLEKVLDEVIDLFPSTYIHIGGDECPKVRWENCTHCQKRMKDENLKDAHALQSYFIQRIEKYVNSHGRKIIGWDEILEGGLAENAAVMSWRGTEGGVEAATLNHPVVMTPGSHCYFDHYQGNPAFEPVAIGGYTPLEKVYGYKVLPSQLSPEKQRYILGAQGNLWTEYMYTEKHVEYMLLPRVLAMAEVVWGTANPTQFEAFQRRVTRHFPFFEKNNMHYSKAIFEIQSRVSQAENKGLYVHLTSGHPTGKIRYTTDGTTPNAGSPIFSDSLKITQTLTLTTAVFDSSLLVSNLYAQTFHFSKATGQRISLKHQAHENYAGNGAKTLVDAQKGRPQKYGQNWLGFSGKDVEALIQFDRETDIQELRFQTIESPGSWIYYPQAVTISISKDGKTFKTISTSELEKIQTQQGNISIRFKKTKCTYVKIELKNAGIIPAGLSGAGNPAWLFVDELELH